MRVDIYEKLEKIHKIYGPREFGKICQKLLAIAFQIAGYDHIVERGVQGVDVDAASNDKTKYAIEVKTTTSTAVCFEQKDADGLQGRKEDHYHPVLAALRLDILSDWIFAKADKIRPGSIYIDLLRPLRMKELENEISHFFNQAVQKHYEGTVDGGQSYLDNILRQKGVDVRRE